ncbi:hypothetical protein PTKIN_Ptkin06aG0089300 [Pterospermum kingtungense]
MLCGEIESMKVVDWCSTIFSSVERYFPSEDLLRRINLDMEEQQVAFVQLSNSRNNDVQIRWKAPPLDVVKINMDGSTKGNPGIADA